MDDIRMLGVQRNLFTAQCTHADNFYNKYLVSFLTIWYMLTISITFVGIVIFVKKIFLFKSRKDFIQNILQSFESSPTEIDGYLDEFVQDYLKTDGMLFVHTIKDGCGDIVMSAFVLNLFQIFKFNKRNPVEDLQF